MVLIAVELDLKKTHGISVHDMKLIVKPRNWFYQNCALRAPTLLFYYLALPCENKSQDKQKIQRYKLKKGKMAGETLLLFCFSLYFQR